MANFIFVIAIDKYADASFSNLSNAKLDSERLIKVLSERYGFETITNPLIDEAATRKNIIEEFNKLSTSLTKDDSLIIYYAGHGHQHTTNNKGFWVPSDASNSISDFIPNSTIIDSIEGIEARHILLISDSCFAGTFLTQTRSITVPIANEKLSMTPSRWLLASGREERVSDGPPGVGSPFANVICEFFEKNTQESTPVGDLFQYVLKYTGQLAKQQPIFSHIEHVGHKGGQMIFKLSVPITSKVISSENQMLKEIVTPLKLAIRLRQIGVPQESIFGHYQIQSEHVVRQNSDTKNLVCSAYLSSELLKYIPEHIDIDDNTYLASIYSYDRITKEQLEQFDHAEVTYQKTGVIDTPFMSICRVAGRMVAFSITEDGKYRNLIRWGRNEAEAIAEMLIALWEERKVFFGDELHKGKKNK